MATWTIIWAGRIISGQHTGMVRSSREREGGDTARKKKWTGIECVTKWQTVGWKENLKMTKKKETPYAASNNTHIGIRDQASQSSGRGGSGSPTKGRKHPLTSTPSLGGWVGVGERGHRP